MNEHTQPIIQQGSPAGGDEHQTVIQFVLSGPIFAGQPEGAHVAAPSSELAELRERVSLLERALSEADSRFEAMQQALAATVAAAAANAVGAASAPARRVPQQPAVAEYAAEPVPEPPAPDPEPAAPDYDLQPVATFEGYAEPAPVTDFAPPPPEPAQYFAAATTTEPVYAPAAQPPADNGFSSPLGDSYATASFAPAYEASPLALAVMPDPEPLSLVTQPAAPALRAPEPGPPKVRGLRRMMAVLKNL